MADLPPGPHGPAAWQTVGWTMRPAAFLARVHSRFGDPVTIRTYWTDEPMVLFSHPDAVREIFRLDSAIAPAGQSWEFLRPFAGAQSILVLDGEEHLRERRLIQTPFHGERMRALEPTVAELARRELSSWSGRVVTLERMKQLTLETILRVVFGVRADQEAAQLRHAVHATLDTVRSMPRMLAMALVQRDLGPWSPWGRFRLAVERFDTLLLDLATRCSACSSSRATSTATRPRTGTCAISSWPCSRPATTPRRPRWPGPSSGSRATPPSMRAWARAIPPTSMRWSRRCCALVPP